MIIDVHTHVFPDAVALKAVPVMAKEADITESLDGRKTSLVESMRGNGIDQVWVQPVATKPAQVESIYQWSIQQRDESVIFFGPYHPGYEDMPAMIHRLAGNGFPGVKIHPEYHQIQPDDPKLFPVYEAVIEEGMIVLFHAGLDIGIPTLHSTPKQFRWVRERFPEMKMILAHMGGFQQWDEVEDLICGLDVYLDTSYSLGHLNDEWFVELVQAHGVDKVLFGTDSPWADQGKELRHLQSLAFTPEEMEMICGGNAEKLVKSVIR